MLCVEMRAPPSQGLFPAPLCGARILVQAGRLQEGPAQESSSSPPVRIKTQWLRGRGDSWVVRFCAQQLRHVQLFVTPWTLACQAWDKSVGLLRQEYWSGLPFPSPGDLSHPGMEPASLMFPAFAGEFFITSRIVDVQILALTFRQITWGKLLNFSTHQLLAFLKWVQSNYLPPWMLVQVCEVTHVKCSVGAHATVARLPGLPLRGANHCQLPGSPLRGANHRPAPKPLPLPLPAASPGPTSCPVPRRGEFLDSDPSPSTSCLQFFPVLLLEIVPDWPHQRLEKISN